MSQEIAILNIGDRAISAQAAQYLANEMAAERREAFDRAVWDWAEYLTRKAQEKANQQA